MQDSLDKPLFYMPVHLQPRVNELENLLFIDRDMILDFHDIIFFSWSSSLHVLYV
jgi:hypothetical protein